jgi:hypothetical protein
MCLLSVRTRPPTWLRCSGTTPRQTPGPRDGRCPRAPAAPPPPSAEGTFVRADSDTHAFFQRLCFWWFSSPRPEGDELCVSLTESDLAHSSVNLRFLTLRVPPQTWASLGVAWCGTTPSPTATRTRRHCPCPTGTAFASWRTDLICTSWAGCRGANGRRRASHATRRRAPSRACRL